jgi:hypothetical protein
LEPIKESNAENDQPMAEPVIIPPKPPADQPKSGVNIWGRSIGSLLLYLAIGYFFFSQSWALVLILTGVVVFHELGHFLAMKFYKYTDLGIFYSVSGSVCIGAQTECHNYNHPSFCWPARSGIVVGVVLQFPQPILPEFEEL